MHAQDRLHSLDAVRAFALLAGIVLHATMSFFLPIPAPDSSQSTTLAVAFYAIHIFRMATFYFIAGFFGRMMFHRQGFAAFARDRAKRIIVPMVVGWIILAPLTIGMVIWGAIRTYGMDVVQNTSSAQMTGAFPLVHLWFLYYLVIFYGLTLALRWIFDAAIDRTGSLRRGIDASLRLISNTYVAPILFAAPICAILYVAPTFQVWSGIPTPDTGLMPKAPAMVAFGTAFGLGWLMHRQIELLNLWKRSWHIHLVAAVGLTVYSLYLAGLEPTVALPGAPPAPNPLNVPGWARFNYAATYALAVWCWIPAIVGGAMRFLSGVSPIRRYIADSSYWLYLIHLPIIFFLQIAMAKWELHWALKFPGILAITLAIGFVSYRYLVRYTFVGAILNGKRFPRPDHGGHPGTTGRPAEQPS